ncbi:MAG: hypothetical protein OTI35_12890 [Sulfitobacter sp.]|nr:hypothetical protein [Sulfitobacter sp.]
MTAQIISVSGPPGSGKSKLVAGLARKMGGTIVAYDDFEIMTSWSPEKVISWLDAGAPLEATIAPRLQEELLSQNGLVFFETPFGRACPDTGGLVTTAIWLECPDDLALARKISALASYYRGNQGFADMITGWLQAYEGFTRRALSMQREKVKPKSDVMLSANQSVDLVLSSAISHLNAFK